MIKKFRILNYVSKYISYIIIISDLCLSNGFLFVASRRQPFPDTFPNEYKSRKHIRTKNTYPHKSNTLPYIYDTNFKHAYTYLLDTASQKHILLNTHSHLPHTNTNLFNTTGQFYSLHTFTSYTKIIHHIYTDHTTFPNHTHRYTTNRPSPLKISHI